MIKPIPVTVLATCFLAASCRSMEFENVQVVDQGVDAATKSYRVQLEFELLDDKGLPIQRSDEPSFEVLENGIPSTSESIRLVDQEKMFRQIVLLLDTSESMSGGLETLRDSAVEFTEKLRQQGFEEITVYRFARTVSRVDGPGAIEASYLADPDERWTSLYHALREVMQANPESVFIVFSDGADNYSQNFGVSGLGDVTSVIDTSGLQVHAIGCGAVRDEMDRDGVGGVKALTEIARNGTYQYVETVDGLDAVFGFIAARLRNVFSLEYYSPNLSGEHELVIRADVGRVSGESEPIPFQVTDDV